MSFPARALRAIGKPDPQQTSWKLPWIPDQAFGLPGMTRLLRGL
jgi:hypothetical protein